MGRISVPEQFQSAKGAAQRLLATTTPVQVRQELIIFGIMVLVGIVVLPPLIYLVGSRAFGPYAGGGLGDLLGNYFHGLAGGSFGFWTIALAPYLVVLTGRLTLGLVRHLSAD